MTAHTISDVFLALGRSLRLVDRPVSLSTCPLLVGETPLAFASWFKNEDFQVEVSTSSAVYQTLEMTPVNYGLDLLPYKPGPKDTSEAA